jgi:hypothetical protein
MVPTLEEEGFEVLEQLLNGGRGPVLRLGHLEQHPFQLVQQRGGEWDLEVGRDVHHVLVQRLAQAPHQPLLTHHVSTHPQPAKQRVELVGREQPSGEGAVP